MRLLALLATGALLAYRSAAYPGGAPDFAVQSMVPGHGGVSAQTAICPYDVSISKNGSVYTLTLQGRAKKTYKGFLVEVRDDKGNRVGSFSGGGPGAAFQLLSHATAVTHVNRAHKTATTFKWSKPKNANKAYRVWYTVVEEFSRFWVAQKKPLP